MKTLTLLALVFFGTASLADSGGAGNGAGGWLCPDGKVELADLYEAAEPKWLTEEGLTIVRTDDETVENQAMSALQKLHEYDEDFGMRVAKRYAEALRDKTASRPGGLAFPPDMRNGLQKPGCQPVGVGLYRYNRDQLLVDFSLLDNMISKTDVAAFWIHEAVYKALNKSFDFIKDSNLARKIVGYLFSNVPAAEMPTNLLFKRLEYFQSTTEDDGAMWPMVMLEYSEKALELRVTATSTDERCVSDQQSSLRLTWRENFPDRDPKFHSLSYGDMTSGVQYVRYSELNRRGLYIQMTPPAISDRSVLECRYDVHIKDFRNRIVKTLPVRYTRNQIRYQWRSQAHGLLVMFMEGYDH